MKSKAQIGGHPLHPILVTIPIGLFVATLAADVIYAVGGNGFFYDVAWWTMAMGVVGVVFAAIPGLIDYLGVARRTQANATALAHMALNSAVSLMYLANLYLRYDHAAVVGGAWWLAFGMDVAAVALLSASGWLGGELVYRYGIGMERDAMRISMLEEDRVGARTDDHVLR